MEHGSGRDDEVNPLTPGNFGWDPIPGYNESVNMTDTQKYPDAIAAVWSSGNPTIAIGGGAFVRGSKWKSYEGSLLLGVLKDKHVRVLVLNQNADSVEQELKLFENEFGRIRSITSGPFDDIYLTTDNGSGKDKIIRVKPIISN
ncbi:PQQ-dependent sugar dehydrogenase [Candidatus Saccharibacteria bacterium]|nr:PQQ-dependent sugar dehydrogenase [Candidatus Saccharibacteria bacterium]